MAPRSAADRGTPCPAPSAAPRLLQPRQRDERAQDLVGSLEDEHDARCAAPPARTGTPSSSPGRRQPAALQRGAQRELGGDTLHAAVSSEKSMRRGPPSPRTHPARVGGVALGRGQRELLLDHLEGADRAAELLALLREGGREVEDAARCRGPIPPRAPTGRN